MHFQMLLKIVHESFGEEIFDTRIASIFVLNYLARSEVASSLDLEMGQAVIKRVSTNLDRLYRMGFLRRRRVSRVVKTRTGKSCNRGYHYLYKLSKQGLQYLNYLQKPVKPNIIYRPDNLYCAMIVEDVRTTLHDDVKPYAEELYKAYFDGYKEVGRYKRFPRKERGRLVLLLNIYREWISDIERENSELKKENSELKKVTIMALELLKKVLDNLRHEEANSEIWKEMVKTEAALSKYSKA